MESNFYTFSEILLGSVVGLFWLAFFSAIGIGVYRSLKESLRTSSPFKAVKPEEEYAPVYVKTVEE